MKIRKSIELILICAIVAVATFGCTPAAAPTEPAAPVEQATAAPAAAATEAPVVAAPTHKVAMVTSGPTNDHGWHQNALEGVTAISKKYGWEMAYSESVAAAQQQNVLRQYAQQGYDLIFCHGYEWGDPLKAVAPDFPDTMFVQINATTEGDNIVGTNFIFGELGYFTGMAAGLMTKNNKIGIVAAQDAPQVTADTDTLQTGALSVNPNADVNVSFVGSWDDVVKGQQVAQAQIDRGVDVLIIIGDAFAPPAIKLAQDKGIMAIGGWSGDAYDLAPDTVITSGVQDVPGVYMSIADQFDAGTLKGNTTFVSGFAEKNQHLGKWGGFVPQDVQDKVNTAVDEYLAGTLDIGLK
jgi:basic membrane lipoprotein Med (substrate-binding protein (PBP1-ABC) superfamily)